jgi:hypothetical protein
MCDIRVLSMSGMVLERGRHFQERAVRETHISSTQRFPHIIHPISLQAPKNQNSATKVKHGQKKLNQIDSTALSKDPANTIATLEQNANAFQNRGQNAYTL